MTDELAVDLEEIHRERLQVHERGHARAEVTEREFAAAPPELAHEIAGVRDAVDGGGLGDLEAQRGGDRRVREAVQNEIHERLLAHGSAGELHRQEGQRMAAALALHEPRHRLSDHPAIEHGHDVVALRGGDELGGRHQLPALVAQPHGQLVKAAAAG